jgi:hypothetical protein
MKKLMFCSLIAFLSLTCFSKQLLAEKRTNNDLRVANKSVESTEAEAMFIRLDVIKAMDMSQLNWTEKRQLRHEVRGIKTKLGELGEGRFLSVGAIASFVLLIVLLL